MRINPIWPTGFVAGVCAMFGNGGWALGQVCLDRPGPDTVVADFSSVANYNAVDGIDAFAVGDRYCNFGTQNLLCVANSPDHPATAQNMYRYRVVNNVGRFEQIGVGWLKHAFAALTDNFCCACNGQGGSVLGVGCSDVSSAAQGGLQCATAGGLGPRFQVNAHTGAFVWPYMFRNDCESVPHTSVTRRVQVAAADLNPVLNPGAMYYFELHQVAPDDAAAGNQDNNASHRRAMISGLDPNYTAAFVGSTQRAQPAIRAWRAIDPDVQLTDLHIPEATVGDTTSLGILGARVTSLGNGLFHYEYALYNMNSDRSFAGFTVPLPRGARVLNVGFHDVQYHSGDGFNSQPGAVTNFDSADWPATVVDGELRWAVAPVTPPENSNALRWGTLYNFRFDCNVPPAPGQVTLDLFKPVAGLVNTMTADTPIPAPLTCHADINGSGEVEVDDLLAIINAWGPCVNPNDCPADIAPPGPPSGDDVVNVDDLLAIINAWGACG